jgi:hypothetical protein
MVGTGVSCRFEKLKLVEKELDGRYCYPISRNVESIDGLMQVGWGAQLQQYSLSHAVDMLSAVPCSPMSCFRSQ